MAHWRAGRPVVLGLSSYRWSEHDGVRHEIVRDGSPAPVGAKIVSGIAAHRKRGERVDKIGANPCIIRERPPAARDLDSRSSHRSNLNSHERVELSDVRAIRNRWVDTNAVVRKR